MDNSGPGPVPAHLDESDTVKIIITMSCDPQTAAQLEESVKQSLLENAQVRIGSVLTCIFLMLSVFTQLLKCYNYFIPNSMMEKPSFQ